jgi:nicotinamide mononucleotide transporter
MTFLSLIALVFGILGVVYTIRQSIWCWPMALVGVVASFLEFYNERLYGDMMLQVFYFFSAIYGWWFWEKRKQLDFKVAYMPFSFVKYLFLLTVLQAIVYYYLLLQFKGDKALFDACLTAASISATYMMTRKWIENWLAWIAIDLLYVVLYGIKNMWLFALLYLVFAIMAAYGFNSWKRKRLLK